MSKLKENLIFVFMVLILASLIYGVTYFNSSTGRVILNVDPSYQQGQPLTGSLKFSLSQGEFIPANSKIVVDNNGKKYEYLLSDVVSEKPSKGTFYVEGTSISGSGEGYGTETKSSPAVEFKLNILSSQNSENQTANEMKQENKNESKIQENQTTTQTQNQSSQEQKLSTENAKNQTEQKNATETKKETKAETSESNNVKEEKPKEKEKSSQENQNGNQGNSITGEVVSGNKKTKSKMTGNAVSGFFRGVFNSFLAITGKVSMNVENEIRGSASKDKPFEYSLSPGQSAEIISGSVKTDGKQIDDNSVSLKVQDGKAVVTTDYSGGKGTKDILINMSRLNVPAENGSLKVSLFYNNESIVSLTKTLGELNLNETQIPANSTLISTKNAQLTDKERKALETEFGNVSVDITKAEQTSNGEVVRFELGKYWREQYYPQLTGEELKAKVQNDMALFLKDLADELLSESSNSTKISGIVGNYKI